MVTRIGHRIGTILAFCALLAAAAYWGYVTKTEQGRDASVVIEQVDEPAWAVQVEQIAPDENIGETEDEVKLASAD